MNTGVTVETSTGMLRHALQLASKGFAVFRLSPLSKIPTAGSSGFKDATRDPEIITQWWTAWPSLNIGIATGAASGVFVLDVDTKSGRNGERSLRTLEDQLGKLPATVECKTPSGGRHLFFKHPGQPVRCTESAIGAGLDTRGDGGYVCAAPSVLSNGRRYYWDRAAGKEFADAPQWLLDKVRAPATNVVTFTPAEDWRSLVRAGVDEGRRNKSVARLAGLLLRRSVDPIVTLDLLISWDQTHCRPPLGERDVTIIVNSILGKEMRRRGMS